jgi:hypothetical protein
LKTDRGLAALVLSVACGAMAVPTATAVSTRLPQAPGSRVAVDPERVEALLINGGGTPSSNYQSHLMHVRMLVDVLRAAGVPDKRITILSGDGEDPTADVALRELQPEGGFWLLSGTRLEGPFRTPLEHESSRVAGFALRAATRVELDRWFAVAAALPLNLVSDRPSLRAPGAEGFRYQPLTGKQLARSSRQTQLSRHPRCRSTALAG